MKARLEHDEIVLHVSFNKPLAARLGEWQMKVDPHTSTQRKQVCLKTHSLAPRACKPILADRLTTGACPGRGAGR